MRRDEKWGGADRHTKLEKDERLVKKGAGGGEKEKRRKMEKGKEKGWGQLGMWTPHCGARERKQTLYELL